MSDILSDVEFKEALRTIANWRGEGGHDMADALDDVSKHDRALRERVKELEHISYGYRDSSVEAHKKIDKLVTMLSALSIVAREGCHNSECQHPICIAAISAQTLLSEL